MNAAVIANGSMADYAHMGELLKKYDCIVCSDGGAGHAYRMNVVPNLMVGDFDSLDKNIMKYYMDSGVKVLKFSSEKDSTDTQLAIDEAARLGADTIDLFGATGTRLDHTMSNIYHLFYIRELGCRGNIIDEHNRIFLAEKENRLYGKKGQIVSLLSLTEDVKGITLEGFKYPLKDAVLRRGNSLCISNEMIRNEAFIYKDSGELLIILSKD